MLTLSGSRDHTLKLWNVQSGECFRTFEGHTSGVASVCLSADGTLALSGSRDATLKLWDVETGRCMRTFKGHEIDLSAVALSPDGLVAASASMEPYLFLLRLGRGHQLLKRLEQNLELGIVFPLQLTELLRKLSMRSEHPPKLDERAHDLDVDADGTFASQNARKHRDARSVNARGRYLECRPLSKGPRK